MDKEMNIDLGFDLPKQLSSIIKVIGVGGGGGNAVNYMYNQGIVGVDFIVCNTDNQALEISPVPNKIQIGNSGLGAGSVPERAREAALEKVHAIEESLVPNTKMLFIVAGMGGGTGTGAAPVIADIARKNNILTVAIVTLPFGFEGRRRQQLAVAGVEELRKHVDSLIIINNNKLRELYGNQRFREAMANVDQVMATAAKRIAEIITVPGYINVDFEDVKTVLKDSKTAIMGYGIAMGENRAEIVTKAAIESPLLNDNQISGSQKILLHITSGSDELTEDEIDEICSFVYDEAGHQVDVFMGYTSDESLGEYVSVSIIATGVAAKELPVVHTLEDGNKEENISKLNEKTENVIPSIVNTYNDDVEEQDGKRYELIGDDKTITAEDNTPGITYKLVSDDGKIISDKNSDIDQDISEEINLKRSNVLDSLRSLSQPLTPEETERLSSEPAYVRKKLVLEDVQPSSEVSDSISLDKNNNVVSNNGNRFLNPMVD